MPACKPLYAYSKRPFHKVRIFERRCILATQQGCTWRTLLRDTARVMMIMLLVRRPKYTYFRELAPLEASIIQGVRHGAKSFREQLWARPLTQHAVISANHTCFSSRQRSNFLETNNLTQVFSMPLPKYLAQRDIPPSVCKTTQKTTIFTQ